MLRHGKGRRCRKMLHACYVRLCRICTVGRVAPTLHIMGDGARSECASLEVQQGQCETPLVVFLGVGLAHDARGGVALQPEPAQQAAQHAWACGQERHGCPYQCLMHCTGLMNIFCRWDLMGRCMQQASSL